MNHESESPTLSEQHADVSAERLARVYAQALLNAADEAGQTAEVLEELDSLVDDVVRHHPQLGALLTGGAVGRNVRRQAIEKALGGRANPVLVKFLLVLNEHERLDLVRPIRQALHQLDNERHHRMPVHVYSAVALPPDFGARIADAVHRRFGVTPLLVTHVDPSLLGGLKIRIGDRQIDASVRSRLDNLRNQAIARSSYEIQSRRDRFRTD